jgi:hypothetical protein
MNIQLEREEGGSTINCENETLDRGGMFRKGTYGLERCL